MEMSPRAVTRAADPVTNGLMITVYARPDRTMSRKSVYVSESLRIPNAFLAALLLGSLD
jgi:hypothetical protein